MFDWLPNCVVRENARAKWVRLKIYPPNRVEVVMPRGFNKDLIPGIVREKQVWIVKVLKKFAESNLINASCSDELLPSSIELRAINAKWTVTYLQSDAYRPAWRENPTHLTITGSSSSICHQQMVRWATNKAYEQLTPRLIALSKNTGLRYSGLTVRNQKTLWGSCSSRQRLSLNFKLLFLPSELTQYVLLHELCHTVHLNHSRKFWHLVRAHQHNYQMLDKELRDAWRYVPRWTEAIS